MNKYLNYTDDALLREYEYMTPFGEPDEKQSIQTVQSMSDTDIMHLLMIMDAMAERIDDKD